MKQQKYFNAKENFALISSMSKDLNLSEKVVELLFSRGIDTREKIEKFFSPSFSDFNDPFLLSGMKEATEKILCAVKEKKRILIFGDYDVDGISATAIMLLTLKKLGATAQYYLPNRFIDGYGLTVDVIKKLQEKFNPELIITVDCGISCAKEVEYAKENGIDIIITDHHEIPDVIPSTVVINPKLEKQDYPFRELCGTGVALKVSQALIGNESNEFLPIASIATIADIVSLREENRAIVALGMKLFEDYLPVGIKMLFKENKISLKKVTSTDIAFKIAPKINSSGRMGEASDSLKLYLETDPVILRQQIAKINDYNIRRQQSCTKVFDDCVRKLKNVNLSSERAIILYDESWDSGILGIVCARLVETYNRPAFLFSLEDGFLKGSARSLPDVNVHEILSSMQDILETFGGHKMAAGLCLKQEYFSEFCNRVTNFIFNKVSEQAFNPITYYDLDIEESQITDKFLEDLDKLEPFGLNNAKPLFRISTSKAKIGALKNFSCHYNISIGRLYLVYFNCSEKYFSLKYAKQKNIIFEIQNKQGNQIKGIVKNFDGGFELDKSFSSTLDAYIFEQFKYLSNKEKCKVNSYNKDLLIELVAGCEKNPFGTIFVASKSETYRNFVSKYCSENISELFVFNNSSDSGYNALYLYPTNLNIFKNYSNIVFLDPVMDQSYLSEIKKYTSGNIYIPNDKNFNKKLFTTLNLSRASITDFFVKLKTLENQNFSNLSHLYNSLSKTTKISFNNFYVYFLVLQELNIITLEGTESLTLKIDSKTKTQLANSKIYNLISYLKRVNK